MVIELKYSNTNTYLVKGEDGFLLFDTAWAGTLPLFFQALGEANVRTDEIKCLLISHFHPDHMGIAENIAELGIPIVVFDVQKEFVHFADSIFEKNFLPIRDENIEYVSLRESREYLRRLGFAGEVFHTPGHSDDSISLLMDSGELFVGDLNPLYELELHQGNEIGKSWDMLLSKNPKKVYYGHAKTAILSDDVNELKANSEAHAANKNVNNTAAAKGSGAARYSLVKQIIKYIDKGYGLEKIQKKTKADAVLIEDVTRMYLTHPNVSVQGILDRIEIKNK